MYVNGDQVLPRIVVGGVGRTVCLLIIPWDSLVKECFAKDERLVDRVRTQDCLRDAKKKTKKKKKKKKAKLLLGEPVRLTS